MSLNPYVNQLCDQTGMTEQECRSYSPKTVPTLEFVRKFGFDSVEEYLDAMHEFLNGM